MAHLVLYPEVLTILGIHLILVFDSLVTAIQHPPGINHKQGRVNAKVDHLRRVALHLIHFSDQHPPSTFTAYLVGGNKRG